MVCSWLKTKTNIYQIQFFSSYEYKTYLDLYIIEMSLFYEPFLYFVNFWQDSVGIRLSVLSFCLLKNLCYHVEQQKFVLQLVTLAEFMSALHIFQNKHKWNTICI